MAKTSGNSRSRKHGLTIDPTLYSTTSLPIDDLIYPHHADILLRLDCINAYESDGIEGALSSAYPRFISDTRRGRGYRESKPALLKFLDLYNKIKAGTMELKPIDVVLRGENHPVYLPPDRNLATMRVPSPFSLVDGGHRVAIAKALGRLTVPVHVVQDSGQIIPDYTSWMHEYGYTPEVFMSSYLNEDYQNPVLCRSSLLSVRDKLWNMYHENAPKTIGHGEFYTDCDLLGVVGQRYTQQRLDTYQFGQWITGDMSVLEIGSNTSFITIEIAKHARTITAIEPDPACYRVASTLVGELYLQEKIRCLNSSLENENDWRGYQEKYDAVVSLAIHHWTSYSFKEYARSMASLVRPNGILMIESHNLKKVDTDWEDKKRLIRDAGFSLIKCTDVNDIPSQPRVVCWFQKKH